jgi:hypothetical protein
MMNLCIIVVAILKMVTDRNFSMSAINSGHHYLPTYQILMISDNVEFLRYCGGHFENGWPVEIFQCWESIWDIIIYPHIKFWWYRAMLNFYRPFTVFWQPFWKWQTSRKFWKRRIAPLMVTYHYVKVYVSIIIHLEVININVRNFNFPIGFYMYSNPHPLWTPQNMTLTPFTTKLKTLGSTRNIYL